MARDLSMLLARACAGLALGAMVVAPAAWAAPLPSDRDHQPRLETEGQAPAETPSEGLDRSNGVISPPQAIDPEMQVRPADPDSRMPVVPPPGSPGGNPGIQPK